MAISEAKRGDAVREPVPSRGRRARLLSLTPVQITVGLILLLALAARIAYVLHDFNYYPGIDGRSYDHLATVLAQGHGWAYGDSAYRPPGVIFFLAGIYWLFGIPAPTGFHNTFYATHASWTTVRIVLAFVGTLNVALIGGVARELVGRRVAVVAMLIAALYLPLIMVGEALMTEMLLVPLVIGAVYCALRARRSERPTRWLVLAGVLCGFAALTRGNGIVVAVALAFVVWTGRPRWRWGSLMAPALLLAVTALTIAPWTVRNAIAQHAFIPVTDELAATIAGTYNDTSARDKFVWKTGKQYKNYARLRNDHHLQEYVRTSRLLSAVGTYIADHPLDVPQAMFWNTLRLLDLQGRKLSRTTARADVTAPAGTADLGVYIFFVVGVLALAGLFTRGTRSVPKVVWLIPFLIWLSEAPITTGTPRFRAALDPFIILVAANSLIALEARVRHRGDARSDEPARRRDPGRLDPAPGAS